MGYPARNEVHAMSVAPGGVPIPVAADVRRVALPSFAPYGVLGAYGDDGLGFKIGNPFKAVGKAAKFVEKKVTRPIGKGVKHAAVQVAKHPLEAAAITAGAGFLSPFLAPAISRVASPLVHAAERVPGVSRVARGVAAGARGLQRVPGVKPLEKIAAAPFVIGRKGGEALLHKLTGPKPPARVAGKPAPAPVVPGMPVPISLPDAGAMFPEMGPPPVFVSTVPDVAPPPPDAPPAVQELHRKRQRAADDANRSGAQVAALSDQLAAIQSNVAAMQAAGQQPPSGWESLVKSIEDKISTVEQGAQKAQQIVNAADQGLQNAQAASMGAPLPFPGAPSPDQQTSMFSNPLVIGGIAVVGVLLLTQGGRSSSRGRR